MSRISHIKDTSGTSHILPTQVIEGRLYYETTLDSHLLIPNDTVFEDGINYIIHVNTSNLSSSDSNFHIYYQLVDKEYVSTSYIYYHFISGLTYTSDGATFGEKQYLYQFNGGSQKITVNIDGVTWWRSDLLSSLPSTNYLDENKVDAESPAHAAQWNEAYTYSPYKIDRANNNGSLYPAIGCTSYSTNWSIGCIGNDNKLYFNAVAKGNEENPGPGSASNKGNHFYLAPPNTNNDASYNIAHSGNVGTGDSNGQVKIAGTNVSVKGLGSNAYSSTSYVASSGGNYTGGQKTAGKCMHGVGTGHAYACEWGSNLAFWVDVTKVATVSDRRLKDDIEEVDWNLVRAIAECKTYQYKAFNRNGLISVGIIAQDLVENCEKYGVDPLKYELLTKEKFIDGDPTLYYHIEYDQYLTFKSLWLQHQIDELKELIENNK